MKPRKLLPISDDFSSEDEYVDQLLHFVANTEIFQILCGGVHVLDFFTSEPGFYYAAIPQEWQAFLLQCEPMALLDLLMRDDLDSLPTADGESGSSSSSSSSSPYGDMAPPQSLVQYIRDIRQLSLRRDLPPERAAAVSTLPRNIAIGMKPKKAHEVASFADYVDRLARDHCGGGGTDDENDGQGVTHLVDFGSGQNYLGRTLASEPYNRAMIAVEGREENISGARALDMLAGVVEKEKVMRNKKAYMQWLDSRSGGGGGGMSDKFKRRLAQGPVVSPEEMARADLRSRREIASEHPAPGQGRGRIHYVAGRLEDGDLSEVLSKVRISMNGGGGGGGCCGAKSRGGDEAADGGCVCEEKGRQQPGDDEASEGQMQQYGKRETDQKEDEQADLRLLAVSIHSCGNLSHHGIRSMLLNPPIKAVAIVGCCYNLMTERLGPPTVKPPFARPTLDSINGRVRRESERRDPHGFPMSRRLATYGGVDSGDNNGVRLNITARMMACQAPQNWTEEESQSFFYRHFYRAVLQRILLDRGAIDKVYYREGEGDGPASGGRAWRETAFNVSTNPVIIGSLRKRCYESLNAYVRGAVDKLTTAATATTATTTTTGATTNREENDGEYAARVREKVAGITDDEIEGYEARFGHRKRELSSVWSLMAFSACVVESLIVTDRWLFLREHGDVVRDCWVEPVFDYRLSPRNLVVVGIKR
ncbi:hypothetical protein RB601_002260 [Gaeumannomyces tritici]